MALSGCIRTAIFPTDPDYCEDYGHDLLTGASVDPIEYRATARAGRAFLKAAHYRPAAEEPDAEYPLEFTTGRTAYHFHTRTKTARAPVLNRAAPGPWVEISPVDAGPLGLAEGDIVEVRSRRGRIIVPVRIGDIRPGTVFAPFHYGYFDTPGPLDAGGERGAANELTLTQWDPVSKQPGFKNAAVAIRKVRAGTAPAPHRPRPHPARRPAHRSGRPSAARPATRRPCCPTPRRGQ